MSVERRGQHKYAIAFPLGNEIVWRERDLQKYSSVELAGFSAEHAAYAELYARAGADRHDEAERARLAEQNLEEMRKREEAIRLISADLTRAVTAKTTMATTLYDLGYRKPEEKK